MKQRVITAIILLLVLALCIWQIYTPVLTVVVAIFSAIASWEVMKCAGLKNKFILILGTAFSAYMQFVCSPLALEGVVSESIWGKFVNFIPMVVYVIAVILLFFIAMIVDYKETTFSQVAISIAASVFIPYAFSSVIKVRDMFSGELKSFGIFLIFFALIASLGTDVGAQLGGMAFGKHKLCPNISPKKTVEGAVCGVVLSAVLNIAAFFIYKAITHTVPENALLAVLICCIPFSILSMFGDLTASVLKRNYGIKDFGKIFPGHGGVMDRFDSSLFTFVLTYIMAIFAF